MTETGISGIVLVPPPGLGNDSKRFEQYMAELIEYASVPVFLYEWPQVDPHFVPPDMLSRLSRRYRLAGIKDTTCTIEGIQAKIVAAGPEMVVYQANTPFLVEAIESGARGIMAVTSAACADLVIRTYEAIIHRHESVRVLHQQLVFLDSVLRFAYPATAKYLANLRGIPMNLACRWPVHVPREAFKAVEVFADAASLYHLQTP